MALRLTVPPIHAGLLLDAAVVGRALTVTTVLLDAVHPDPGVVTTTEYVPPSRVAPVSVGVADVEANDDGPLHE